MNIVITGTCSGLGHALRVRYTVANHRILGSTVHPERVDSEQALLELRNVNSIEEFAGAVRHRFPGGVDVLINNAGINGICQFRNLNKTFLRDMMAVNFEGPVLLTQALLPLLKKVKGTVVNVVSDASWRPMRHSLAYNCSKAALAMATKQMARELTKPEQITVFSVNPGKMMNTEMSRYIDEEVCNLRGWTPEQAYEYFANNSVVGVETPPSVVANHIYMLTQGEMRPYISGTAQELVG